MSDGSIEPAPAARRGSALYLLPIVLLPLLLLASAFVVIPSRWFAMRSGNNYLPTIGYGAGLSGRNCQVLIYGDSTAMVGVDPKIIEAQTGLTACNIAEFAGFTLVSGTLPVDRFLARNPRPKFIVFVYGPEDLSHPRSWDHVSTFEAITDRVAREKNWDTAVVLATHPNETLSWAEQGMRFALQRLRTKPMAEAQAHVREGDLGQFKVAAPDLTTCGEDAREYAPDPAWVARFRSRYAVDGTRVIVDATPDMDCDAGIPYYRAHLKGLVDDADPYPVYPVRDFLDENGMHLHMNAKGSAKLSAMIGSQVHAAQGE